MLTISGMSLGTSSRDVEPNARFGVEVVELDVDFFEVTFLPERVGLSLDLLWVVTHDVLSGLPLMSLTLSYSHMGQWYVRFGLSSCRSYISGVTVGSHPI